MDVVLHGADMNTLLVREANMGGTRGSAADINLPPSPGAQLAHVANNIAPFALGPSLPPSLHSWFLKTS